MNSIETIALDVLDVLPNPILIKDGQTRYVWVNRAFESLFDVKRDDLIGRLDRDVFPDRQVAQCNGGDLRVLATGELDEATEIVADPMRGERHTITRKIRQIGADGQPFLVGVMHDITDVTIANQRFADAAALLESQATQLRVLATTDPLTGCLNRRALDSDAKERLAADGTGCAVLLLDLDHFKRVNDANGHSAGDAALKHFADCVRSVLRATDVLARIGGEEFAALLVGADLRTAEDIAERICEVIRNTPFVFDGRSISLTVSIGVMHHATSAEPSVDDLLRLADVGLYQAKSAGRDRFVTASG
ncbi:MAG TPA: GGDEF domain-containing protein [Baekduia sp.]|nr:GGDEF domain-containing protein [Baekduia sp.]